MASLLLTDVNKSFAKVDVIHNVDLNIADGELVVFVGPSGCGKSTLLRLIAGLETPTTGDIKIGDRDVTDADPADRGVAMVFQSYALYPHMTVAENMGFGLKMNGMAKEEISARVQTAAKTLHLDELLARKPKQLSGGQRQRVAIGRAIVRQPDVFLFDEPLSNLDAELRVQMRLELARLHKELDATMIYVTHDQVEAMTLADKIVVLRGGRIEQIGSPLELYREPVNLFVAGFIGSPRMNFLGATVAAVDGYNVRVKLNDFSDVAFDVSLGDRKPGASEPVLVGVRPEQFSDRGDVRLSLPVELVEHLGGTSYAYARPRPDAPMMTVETDNKNTIGAGETLDTGFDSHACAVFDPNSELRYQ